MSEVSVGHYNYGVKEVVSFNIVGGTCDELDQASNVSER